MKEETKEELEQFLTKGFQKTIGSMPIEELRKLDWLSTPERADYWINKGKEESASVESNWESEILKMFEITHKYETMPPIALVAELFEEGGEFAEAMLKENGYLRHKEKEFEGPMGEAADIINVVIGALTANYPEKTPEELTSELLTSFIKKGQKYAGLIQP